MQRLLALSALVFVLAPTGCKDSEAAELTAVALSQSAEEPAPDTPNAAATIVTLADRPAKAQNDIAPTITVSAVGDCTLGSDYRVIGAEGSFHLAMDKWNNDYSVPFASVKSILDSDDLTIANLETPLSRSKPAVANTFVFNGKPEYAEILARGSVELVNLANNHTGDFGPEGAKQTVSAVEKVGIGAFGNGRVDKRTVKGVEVVNIGYLGGGRGTRDKVVKDVKKHKTATNLVIVSFHWGVEGLNVPTDDQRTMAHAVVDAGADLVLGHHPHVLQGIESYKGRHIVYSLGNFVFGGHSNPADKDSMIYQEVFSIENGAVSTKENKIIPVRISSVTSHNDFRPVVLEGADKERVLGRVKEYSNLLLPKKKK
ncbi:MAG: CapA family protein [Polyangiaceae bacterium]|nr:CapA family protein [Polyangiaceae bacterium]